MADETRPTASKRFYAEAAIAPAETGYALVLDGRPARTPARAPLLLPTRALGEAIAAEWQAQGDTIDPRTMPMTKLANSAIDGVARDLESVRDDIARYAGSDLVIYRASEPELLVSMQRDAWDPVLAFAREELGAAFVLASGVSFVAQPPEALARVSARLSQESSPFTVAALHVLTTLTGSALIALMHASGRLSASDAWAAAHVDETFQESRWGRDAEAAERRAARQAEFQAASRLLSLARRVN